MVSLTADQDCCHSWSATSAITLYAGPVFVFCWISDKVKCYLSVSDRQGPPEAPGRGGGSHKQETLGLKPGPGAEPNTPLKDDDGLGSKTVDLESDPL